MSFDPNQGPPNRPRSTPIPDDGTGLSMPPPTAAQFLRESGTGEMTPPQHPGAPGFGPGFGQGFGQPTGQPGFGQPGQPGCAQPGFQPQTGIPSQGLPYVAPQAWTGGSFNVGAGGVPFVSAGTGFRGLRIGIILFSLVLTLGIAGYVIWKTNTVIDDARTTPQVPAVSIPPFTIPDFTVPSIPDVSIPNVSIPDITLPTNLDLPPITVPGGGTVVTSPVTVDPTVTTVAVPPATAFPGGANSLYEGNAARSVVDQMNQSLAAGATQFTQVIIFPEYVVATAQDPANPAGLTGSFWRDGGLTPATVTADGGPDLATQIFPASDVNWDAIAALVPAAPSLLGIADGTVDHIIVQKSVFEAGNPVTFSVYVTGATQNGYVSAAADGTVLSTH